MRDVPDHLTRNRITPDELASRARLAEVAHVEDVEWAVFETSGEISLIRKD